MSNISFIIFAYNEEKRIEYVIKNFIGYGDVYILDGGSTDKTKEIAERLGAKFYVRPPSTKPQVETTEIFNFIKSIIKTDWIYWGYTDNIAPKTLVEKFVEIAKENRYKMVHVPLYTFLWGNVKHHALKSYIPVLFHKDFNDYSQNCIHNMGMFLGTKEQLLTLPNEPRYALTHFSTYNGSKFVKGHLNYAETEALEKFERGKKFSLIRMFAAMIRYCWIYGRYSYKNGTLGILIVLNYAFFRVMAYTKLYELEHNITLDTIEATYSKEKEKMMREFEERT